MKQRLFVLLPIVVLLPLGAVAQESGTQRALYECTEPMAIDTSLFKVRPGETYFHFDKNLKPEGLKSKGFNWLPDTPRKYFTAYLINTSDSAFNADRQDGSLIMIQQAMHPKGYWMPVEYWTFSGCGNSYFNPLKLDSGEYVMIPIKLYEGCIKTKFRLKMKKGDTIFYSETFEGTIERSQFDKHPGDVHGILYHGPASYLEKK